MGMKDLVCWEMNGLKMWEMIKKDDFDAFMLDLFQNPNVDNHTIFFMPTSAIMGAIWGWGKSHKSNRVNFSKFFEDYGTPYVKPVPKEDNNKILREIHEKTSDTTKYGWVSPDGCYYHCNYQGHISLANRICFGMTSSGNSELYLEDNGWCKISKSMFDNEYRVYMGGNHILTDKQFKTLKDMGLENVKGIDGILMQ